MPLPRLYEEIPDEDTRFDPAALLGPLTGSTRGGTLVLDAPWAQPAPRRDVAAAPSPVLASPPVLAPARGLAGEVVRAGRRRRSPITALDVVLFAVALVCVSATAGLIWLYMR
jgi:hypothetical protein